MGLDVCLTTDEEVTVKGTGVFIREGGRTVELTPEQVAERWPEAESASYRVHRTNDVFTYNITHNLNTMADAAGIYRALWRPEEVKIDRAHQLIGPLTEGLAKLEADPARFKALNPPNGWGDYDGLKKFVSAYLAACRRWPHARVTASV